MCRDRASLDFEIMDAETNLPMDSMTAMATAIELHDGYIKVSGLTVHGHLHQQGKPSVVNAVIKIALGKREDFETLDSYQDSLGTIPVRSARLM